MGYGIINTNWQRQIFLGYVEQDLAQILNNFLPKEEQENFQNEIFFRREYHLLVISIELYFRIRNKMHHELNLRQRKLMEVTDNLGKWFRRV